MLVLRFVTLILAALSMGNAFAHLLEMPAKLAYDPQLYLAVQQTLYRVFGLAAGLIEVGAVAASVALALRLRQQAVVSWTLLGAACQVVALAAWFGLVAPMNAEMFSWTPASMPLSWTLARDQWEYAHAGRAIVLLIGFGALVYGALTEPRAATTGEVEAAPEAGLSQRAGYA